MISAKLAPKLLQVSSILAFFTGAIALQYQQLTRLENTQSASSYHQQEKSLQVFLKAQQNFPTFGFDNLLGDWTYLQFIQYFGDYEAREITGYSNITGFLQLLAEQNPRFVRAFLYLSIANSVYAGKPEVSVELLEEITRTATPQVSDEAFFLWIYKAVDELLFLADPKAAQRSYLMASDWASQRGDEIGQAVAQRTRESAQLLAENPDSRRVAISAWINILNNVRDDATKQNILERIESLGAQVTTDAQGQLQISLPPED